MKARRILDASNHPISVMKYLPACKMTAVWMEPAYLDDVPSGVDGDLCLIIKRHVLRHYSPDLRVHVSLKETDSKHSLANPNGSMASL